VFKNRGPRYRSSTDTLGTKWEGRRVAVPNWPALHPSCPVANRPFFRNMKITKRTQFKNRTTRHLRQPRRTTLGDL
jgi:hypothetical protein